MFKLLVLILLVSTIHCDLIEDIKEFIEKYPEDSNYEDHSSLQQFDLGDISAYVPCEQCSCSANFCCPGQPFFIPALICARQCIRNYPIELCVCACLNVFQCCI